MRSITQETTFNGHPLSYSKKNDDGCYKEILKAAHDLLNHMIQRHSSVFFTRFDLTFPENTAWQYQNNNELLSRFLETLIRHFDRQHHDPKYLWVREHSRETGQFHYHLMLLQDGNVTQNANGLRVYATQLWAKCLGIESGEGILNWCETGTDIDKYGGVKIIRKAPDFHHAYDHCFQRASYMAKCFSKGDLPPYVKGYDSSRI